MMIQYFSQPHERSGGNVKVEFDPSYYGTKPDLKGTPGADTAKLAPKTGLASLKAEVDKIDANKIWKLK